MSDLSKAVASIGSRVTDTPNPQRQSVARVPSDPNTLPLPLVEPKLSPRLDHSVGQVERPHADIGAPKAWPAAVQAEARVALDELRTRAKRVHPTTIQLWSDPMQMAVRNPPAEKDFDAWCLALAITCQDYSEIAFTERTQRLALGEFQFWPAVADVVKLLAPVERRFRARLTALRTIAEGNTEAPPAPRPDGPVPVPDWVGDRSSRHLGPAEPSEIDAAAADAEALLSRARQLDQLANN